MGNTLPITSVPKPTESRAIIYIYSMGMLGTLQVEKDGIATVPSSLDGSVPDCVFGAAVDSISERCCSFRGEFCFSIVTETEIANTPYDLNLALIHLLSLVLLPTGGLGM